MCTHQYEYTCYDCEEIWYSNEWIEYGHCWNCGGSRITINQEEEEEETDDNN